MKRDEIFEALKKLENYVISRINLLNSETIQHSVIEIEKKLQEEMKKCEEKQLNCKLETVNKPYYISEDQELVLKQYRVIINNEYSNTTNVSNYYIAIRILKEKNKYNPVLTAYRISLLRDNKCDPYYDECTHIWKDIILELSINTDEQLQKALKYYVGLNNRLKYDELSFFF